MKYVKCNSFQGSCGANSCGGDDTESLITIKGKENPKKGAIRSCIICSILLHEDLLGANRPTQPKDDIPARY